MTVGLAYKKHRNVPQAQYLCMMMRGVEKQNSSMTTSMMLGLFRRDDRTRAEFLNLIKS